MHFKHSRALWAGVAVVLTREAIATNHGGEGSNPSAVSSTGWSWVPPNPTEAANYQYNNGVNNGYSHEGSQGGSQSKPGCEQGCGNEGWDHNNHKSSQEQVGSTTSCSSVTSTAHWPAESSNGAGGNGVQENCGGTCGSASNGPGYVNNEQGGNGAGGNGQGSSVNGPSVTVPTSLACSAVSSSLGAQAGVATPSVSPSLAFDCLLSVPLDVPRNEALIDDIILPYISWHSTLDHLKNPPAGYLVPGVDVLTAMVAIREKLRTGGYANQYECMKDIVKPLFAASDSYFYYKPKLLDVFSFKRTLHLASISEDGRQLPKIYDIEELKGDNPNLQGRDIVSIDGMSIQDVLGTLSFFSAAHDPDAKLNSLLSSLPLSAKNKGNPDSGFNTARPGMPDQHVVVFSDSTSKTYPNRCLPKVDFLGLGIDSGQSLHEKVELPTPTGPEVGAQSVPSSVSEPGASGSEVASSSLPSSSSVPGGDAARMVRRVRRTFGSPSPVEFPRVKRTSGSPSSVVSSLTLPSGSGLDALTGSSEDELTILNLGSGSGSSSIFSQANDLTAQTGNTKTVTALEGYPTPRIIHPDGIISGYFLSSDSETCVLSINSFAPASFTDPTTNKTASLYLARSVMTQFLTSATSAGRKTLIIDLSANSGAGLLFLAIDLYNMLFPTPLPTDNTNTNGEAAPPSRIPTFTGHRLRATEVLKLHGLITYKTPSEPQSILGPVTGLDGTSLASPKERHPEWIPNLFGPVNTGIDGKALETNLIEFDFENTTTFASDKDTLIPWGITGSKFAEDTQQVVLDPAAIKFDKIVVLTDGTCGAACAEFVGLVQREQKKVPVVVVGGRPLEAPMQAAGGVKGFSKTAWGKIFTSVEETRVAQGVEFVDPELKLLLPKDPKTSPLEPTVLNATFASIGLRNSYPREAQAGGVIVPLQFVYEAAHCRLFYTVQSWRDMEVLWKDVVDTAVKGEKACVRQSTGVDGDKIAVGTDGQLTAPGFIEDLVKCTGPAAVYDGPGSLTNEEWKQLGQRNRTCLGEGYTLAPDDFITKEEEVVGGDQSGTGAGAGTGSGTEGTNGQTQGGSGATGDGTGSQAQSENGNVKSAVGRGYAADLMLALILGAATVAMGVV